MTGTSMGGLMQTCIWMFHVVAPLAYESISVTEKNAEQWCRTMCDSKGQSIPYQHQLSLISKALSAMPQVECVRFTEQGKRTPMFFKGLEYCAGTPREPPPAYQSKYSVRYLRMMSAVFGDELTGKLLLNHLTTITVGHYDARVFSEGVLPIVRARRVYGRCIFAVMVLTRPLAFTTSLKHILEQLPPVDTLEYYQRMKLPASLIRRLEKINTPSLPPTSICVNIPVDEAQNGYSPILHPGYLSAVQKALYPLSFTCPRLRLIRYGNVLWKMDKEAEMWTPKPDTPTMGWWRHVDVNRIADGVAAIVESERSSDEVTLESMGRFWRM
ncbi:hypothetical protein PLICRDRAFT_32885 [Plicaturopsis crispa FD-325 SS-3]|uniref:PNPLA domain-containing protein n=1 Tax=Plicaturopsis crispa FD-325 SS-3 TaxID=944288 RepID=A0A0C9T610_PLICR|nr:hypothetical protein PLICRDRAFT_32885 [Plicaturopsis crispa FD-325 SS-3]